MEQQQLSELLEKQREQQIDAIESRRLEDLMESYRRGLLLKARALKEAVKRVEISARRPCRVIIQRPM